MSCHHYTARCSRIPRRTTGNRSIGRSCYLQGKTGNQWRQGYCCRLPLDMVSRPEETAIRQRGCTYLLGTASSCAHPWHRLCCCTSPHRTEGMPRWSWIPGCHCTSQGGTIRMRKLQRRSCTDQRDTGRRQTSSPLRWMGCSSPGNRDTADCCRHPRRRTQAHTHCNCLRYSHRHRTVVRHCRSTCNSSPDRTQLSTMLGQQSDCPTAKHTASKTTRSSRSLGCTLRWGTRRRSPAQQ
jgi:hypothetical protein